MTDGTQQHTLLRVMMHGWLPAFYTRSSLCVSILCGSALPLKNSACVVAGPATQLNVRLCAASELLVLPAALAAAASAAAAALACLTVRLLWLSTSTHAVLGPESIGAA